jgi:hypothetical protein
MQTTHSIEDLKHYHNEATQFFAAQLMLLKEGIPKIADKRIAQAGTLLMSSGQTGAALLQLSSQTDVFTKEVVMLARAFIEAMTNFCYVSICDEKEYRAFILHPIYKRYHRIGSREIVGSIVDLEKKIAARKQEQEAFKKNPIVKAALELFSETNANLNWTKKNLRQRIAAIKEWGKVLDFFFSISKYEYYADASEALHGSLYGCTFHFGAYETDFDYNDAERIAKKGYKDTTCILLQMGMLIHESFTVISYTDDIKEIWDYSF